MQRPLILITNDDGIDSPGLLASIAALRSLGDLLIVAPMTQQTSLSRAFPKVPDLGKIETRQIPFDGEILEAHALTGSPAFCVSHAVLELAQRPINLCVSGINYGENLGLSLMPSGTIGAAFEADSYNIPAIAASMEVPSDQHHSNSFNKHDWSAAINFTRRLAENVLQWGYLRDVAVWNLNIPASATSSTPYRFTRQSRQNYFVFRKPLRRTLNEPAKLPVEIEIDASTLEPDSDIQCVIIDKCISITPLTWDLTSIAALESREPSLIIK